MLIGCARQEDTANMPVSEMQPSPVPAKIAHQKAFFSKLTSLTPANFKHGEFFSGKMLTVFLGVYWEIFFL